MARRWNAGSQRLPTMPGPWPLNSPRAQDATPQAHPARSPQLVRRSPDSDRRDRVAERIGDVGGAPIRGDRDRDWVLADFDRTAGLAGGEVDRGDRVAVVPAGVG